MLLVNKRQILVRFGAFALLVMLALGYIAYFHQTTGGAGVAPVRIPNLSRSASGGGQVAPAGNFFATYRLRWEQANNLEMNSLQAIVDDPSAGKTEKTQANALLLDLIREQQQETAITSLLQAKGFPQTAVALTPSSAVVIVKAAALDRVQAARIGDVVTTVTGLSLQDVSIIPET